MNERVEREAVVLVVEDDESVAGVLARFVLRRHWRVAVASSVRTALGIARTRVVGAILDVRLPDGSGLDLVPPLRAGDPAMPILVVTGHANPEFANASHLLDVGYARKPDVGPNIERLLERCGERATEPTALRDAQITDALAQYRLSDAELRVVRAWANAGDRASVAGQLGRSVNTVKSQTKALLAKTGDPTVAALLDRVRHGERANGEAARGATPQRLDPPIASRSAASRGC